MRLLKLILVLVLLFGCAAPAPMIDYDSNYDFTKARTFKFISEHPLIRGKGAEVASSMLEDRLIQATENILRSRGFTQVADPEKADFAVGFTFGGRENVQVENYPESYRTSVGGTGWGSANYYANTRTVRPYTEGTLSVDIYDGQDHRPVWHGRTVRKITKRMQNNPDDTVHEILSGIFTAFPPS